jgi:hypothetical protein
MTSVRPRSTSHANAIAVIILFGASEMERPKKNGRFAFRRWIGIARLTTASPIASAFANGVNTTFKPRRSSSLLLAGSGQSACDPKRTLAPSGMQASYRLR